MPSAVPWVLIASQVLALLMLVRQRLVRPFSALWIYLAVCATRSLILQQWPRSSDSYFYAWSWSIPFIVAAQVAMAAQAYGRSLEHYPGVRQLSHAVLLVLATLAALAAQPFQHTFTAMGYFSRLQQAIAMALAAFSLAMILLMNVFYSPRRRANAIRHEWILTAHLTSVAAAFFAVHNGYRQLGDVMVVAASAACCCAWAFLLTPAGETLPPRPAATGSEHQIKAKAAAQVAGLTTGIREGKAPSHPDSR